MRDDPTLRDLVVALEDWRERALVAESRVAKLERRISSQERRRNPFTRERKKFTDGK